MIVIETDLDVETAKEKFLSSVQERSALDRPVFVGGIPVNLHKTKEKPFGGIVGGKIWFDNSGLVKNKGVVNKHEFVGTIEEKDGKAVIRGEFDKQRGGNFILIIFIIMVAVKLIFSLKAPVINTGEVVLCSAAIAFGVYACYKYKPGFSSIEKRELDALSEIFEATNVYDDKKRTKDEKNGGLW